MELENYTYARIKPSRMRGFYPPVTPQSQYYACLAQVLHSDLVQFTAQAFTVHLVNDTTKESFPLQKLYRAADYVFGTPLDYELLNGVLGGFDTGDVRYLVGFRESGQDGWDDFNYTIEGEGGQTTTRYISADLLDAVHSQYGLNSSAVQHIGPATGQVVRNRVLIDSSLWATFGSSTDSYRLVIPDFGMMSISVTYGHDIMVRSTSKDYLTQGDLSGMSIVAQPILVEIMDITASPNVKLWDMADMFAEDDFHALIRLLDQGKGMLAAIDAFCASYATMNWDPLLLINNLMSLGQRVVQDEGTIASNSDAISALDGRVTELESHSGGSSSGDTDLYYVRG